LVRAHIGEIAAGVFEVVPPNRKAAPDRGGTQLGMIAALGGRPQPHLPVGPFRRWLVALAHIGVLKRWHTAVRSGLYLVSIGLGIAGVIWVH
jgi:hypothetical protein